VESASFAVKPAAPAAATPAGGSGQAAKYNVNVNGTNYAVVVSPAGTMAIVPSGAAAPAAAPEQAVAAPSGGGSVVPAPVAGTLLRYAVEEGASVNSGDTIIIMESMKMELEIKATATGAVHFLVPPGTQVAQQQSMAEIR
jgi:oxaloacetate decarboxylase alpha subunit